MCFHFRKAGQGRAALRRTGANAALAAIVNNNSRHCVSVPSAKRLLHLAVLILAALPSLAAEPRVLRVCADPNNLPFSNSRSEGFENRLAELVAQQLGARLEYTWWSERKSFVKGTLDEGRCDVVMGVPAALDSVTATRPYYRSTYVFVSRADRNLKISSLTDARLADWRIGVHVVGDDYAPPAHALAHRGLAANIVGYSLFGADGEENPPRRLLDAVASGDVDVAIVWGPFAGYFAPKEKARLEISPVSPPVYLAVPFVYDIAMGVRKGNVALKNELDAALERACAAIGSVLRNYGVPSAPGREGESACESSQQSPAVSSR